MSKIRWVAPPTVLKSGPGPAPVYRSNPDQFARTSRGTPQGDGPLVEYGLYDETRLFLSRPISQLSAVSALS
jgi:hypothetical protein